MLVLMFWVTQLLSEWSTSDNEVDHFTSLFAVVTRDWQEAKTIGIDVLCSYNEGGDLSVQN